MSRHLGEIEVSDIGLGCMGLSQSYGIIPDEDAAIEAIRTAFDHGCRFFDTAQSYGQGANEELVGKALKPVRDQAVICTKFFFGNEDASHPEDLEQIITAKLNQSLVRLQTDYVDLFLLHRIDERIPVEEVAKVMAKLIDQNKIRGWGLSQSSLEEIQKAHVITPLSVVESIYSISERDSEKEILPFCLKHNIGFVAFSPLGSGLLSGSVHKDSAFSRNDVRSKIPQMQPENLERNEPLLETIQRWADKKNCTPAQLSLAWMLKKYPNIIPIPGSRKPERIIENLQAADVHFSDEEFDLLEKELSQIEVYGHRGNVETAQNSWAARNLKSQNKGEKSS